MPHVTKKVIVNTTKNIESNIVMSIEMNIGVKIMKHEVNHAKVTVMMNTEGMNMVMNNVSKEVDQLAALKHENIIKILGVALNGDKPCILLEYAENGSLDRLLYRTFVCAAFATLLSGKD